MSTAKPKALPLPWHPAPYEAADVWAWKALAEGNASEPQQKRIVKHLVEVLGQTYDNTTHFGPEGSRLSDFAAGRRFVGLSVVKFLNYPVKLLKGTPHSG